MATITTTLAVQRRIYKDIVENGKDAVESVSDRIFSPISGTEGTIEIKEISGFGWPVETADGGEVSSDDRQLLYTKTYSPLIYTLKTERSPLAKRTDQYGIFNQDAAAIGRMFGHWREKRRANVFNNGFNASYTGADGQELFDVAHPQGTGNPTLSNEFTTPLTLSTTALKSAIQNIHQQVSARNAKMKVTDGFHLVVPDSLMFTAMEITESLLEPESANNRANVVRRYIQPLHMTYLSDQNNWFLVPRNKADHGLSDYQVISPTVNVHEADRDDLKDAIVVYEACIALWKHPRGIYGSEVA